MQDLILFTGTLHVVFLPTYFTINVQYFQSISSYLAPLFQLPVAIFYFCVNFDRARNFFPKT